MSKTSMSGCDAHDKNLVLKTAMDHNASRRSTFQNTRSGRQSLIAKLKKDAESAGCSRIVLAYEASGQGYGLYDELSEAGIECYVLAPTLIARSPRQKKSKNDDNDADQILELLRGHVLAGNKLPSVNVPGFQQRDDREIMRCRLDLADKLKEVKTQIKSLLKRVGVERPSEIGKGWTKKQKEWLKDLIKKKGSVLESGAQVALGSLMRQLESVRAEIKRIDKRVEALGEEQRHKERVERMTKLKGVGVLSALVFLVELGDMKRFKNRRKIGAYLGVVPSSNESGERNDRKGHITRQGSPHVRRVLCQCVWARVRSDPQEKEVYERLVARNPKKKKIAIVAIMRRLAIRMWHAAQEPVEMKAGA